MKGLLLCTNASKVPYYIKDVDMNIYSIEELAYYLYHNVYLIDEDFFQDGLLEYIENDLSLPQIANGIRQAKEHNRSLVEIISYVVKASGYYETEELKQLNKELELLGTKTGLERMKAKADILLGCKKYNSAYECYRYILLKHRDQTLQPSFYGSVCNNMGIVCANMFKYEKAAQMFRNGYKISRDMIMLRHLLMADMLGHHDVALQEDISQFHISTKMLEECKARINAAKVDEQEQEESETIPYAEQINSAIHTYKADI